MDSPFTYDHYVTGKNFIGRKVECNSLANLLEKGENVVIYSPSRTGKASLIQQTLFNMRVSGKPFMVAQVDLFNVRNTEDFLLTFAKGVIRPHFSTPDEYASVVEKYLQGTHFVFDMMKFSTRDEVVSLDSAPDKDDISAMLRLPQSLASDRNLPFHIVISDFQNIMMTDDYDWIVASLKDVFSENASSQGARVDFILSGSKVNAMKYIFEQRKDFFRQVTPLPIYSFDEKEIVDYVIKGFTVSGKVIERDLVSGACRLFKFNMWYINQFFSICDSMSKGFINSTILMDALNAVIAIHQPRFQAITDDLTDFQMSLLRAVLDGVVKFSSTEVIEKYGLNSSANVRRVKDALMKKEVISFNEKEEPYFLDPLYQYWITNIFWEIKEPIR